MTSNCVSLDEKVSINWNVFQEKDRSLPLYYISEDQWQIQIHIRQITRITVEETGKKIFKA